MPDFVLTAVDGHPGSWTGPAGAKVKVGVTSDSNSSSFLSASYPGGVPLPADTGGATATLTLLSDNKAHALAVDITPGVPTDDWYIVEIAANGNTQVLLGLASETPVGACKITNT